jgi:hypothetical protein
MAIRVRRAAALTPGVEIIKGVDEVCPPIRAS